MGVKDLAPRRELAEPEACLARRAGLRVLPVAREAWLQPMDFRLDVPARAKESALRAKDTAVETYRESPPAVIGAMSGAETRLDHAQWPERLRPHELARLADDGVRIDFEVVEAIR